MRDDVGSVKNNFHDRFLPPGGMAQNMSKPIIEVNGFSFWYPARERASLNEINLTVRAGEFILLTGSTGCGKSTLLKCFNGIIPHLSGGTHSGTVSIKGRDTKTMTMSELSSQTGLVQQSPDDQIFATVIQDEVAFGPENLCLAPAEIENRLNWALDAVDLKVSRLTSTNFLSGGQKQRLAIAAMMALKPEILALDEPISQLDPQGAAEVLEVIKKLNRQYAVTVIMVEHRIHEVAQYADRIIVMESGQIALDAPVREAMAKPHLFANMGLRLPETVEISRLAHSGHVTLTVEETVSLLKAGRAKEAAQKKSDCTIADCTIADCTIADCTIADCKITDCKITDCKMADCKMADLPGGKVLEIHDLAYRYTKGGKLVLKEVNITVRQGEKVAVMGRNGAGKSTLLSHMAALTTPQQGTVKIAGQPVNKKSKPPLGVIGLVLQNPDLMLFNSSVRQEIKFGLRNLKVSANILSERYEQVIEGLMLDCFQDDPPLALSRGQRLRTAIAAVVAMQPNILFLDEPTTGQDKQSINNIMSILLDQINTLVFCTHDVEIALKYATRVIVIDQGEIVADDVPRKVFSDSLLLSRSGLRPTQTWLISQELGLDGIFTPDELIERWIL